MLHDLKFKYHIEAIYNESLIPRGRNHIVRKFMELPDMTHLMFIDADIGFTELDVLRLIVADRDVSAAAYPKKRINWPLVKRAVAAGKDKPEDFAGDFAFNVLRDGDEGTVDEDGMVEVKQAGTGFMLIKKKVFKILEPFVPVWKEVRDDGEVITGRDFFQIGVDESGFYVSEDYFFCNLWRRQGGSIFLNPFINLNHTGSYIYTGSLARLGTEAI